MKENEVRIMVGNGLSLQEQKINIYVVSEIDSHIINQAKKFVTAATHLFNFLMCLIRLSYKP